MDPIVKKLVSDVDELKQGHADILKAVKENTDMTAGIVEILGYVRGFFKAIGWTTHTLARIFKPVGYIAGGISAVLVLMHQMNVNVNLKFWEWFK